MSRSRKLHRNPSPDKNYYIIDASFLVNKYIPPNRTPDTRQKTRLEKCIEWWTEIDNQIRANKARVYIPDICIAETFKVLARRYYDKWFHNHPEYSKARKRLTEDITIPDKMLRAPIRQIKYHDISTSRDIIISVDRFYEVFNKEGLAVELPDLVILATAKYLMDFYDIPKNRLHIVTCDKNLRNGSKKIYELPNAYDPTITSVGRKRVFISYQPRMV